MSPAGRIRSCAHGSATGRFPTQAGPAGHVRRPLCGWAHGLHAGLSRSSPARQHGRHGVVEGTFTLEFKDRAPVVRKAGEALLEPINVVLRAANNNQTEAAKVVIFQASSPDVPFMHSVH